MSPLVLSGMVEHGQGKGRTAGFPTANLHCDQVSLPAYGVYASLLLTKTGKDFYGVTNVGTRPTVDQNSDPTVETWLPGYCGDLYGQEVSLILLDYLRPIKTFPDLYALKEQIDEDAERAADISSAYAKNSLWTRSASETQEAGCRLARYLRSGDVLTLSGPLGAGKSEMARGIARGLGIEGVLPSPTFTILNAYESGRLPLYHYDWYRIEDPEELIAIGAEEHLPGECITLIEWSEQAPEMLPEERLGISLLPIRENERMITFTPSGSFRSIETWMSELNEKC